ncbi:MAG: hypothetical protein J1E65_03285 [Lachnospiraceae bacterium]|nr:hypothetical protein [Lachnospiraceae bacterium]
MNYETIINICERTGRVTLEHVQEVLERLYAETEETGDAIEQYCKIDTLIEQVFTAKTLIGNSSSYHNVAVVLARNEAFDYACDILELGIKKSATSVDLLADYLNYGCRCNRQEKCDAFFAELCARQDTWNWRAYQFAINYLLEIENYGSKCDVHKINDLVKAFLTEIPEREEAYLSKAEWLKKMPQSERISLWGEETYESVLKDVTDGKYRLKRTPKCDLNLADYYYSMGINFMESFNLLERCKKDSIEIQASINRTYVYLLSALCKMSIYYEKVKDYDSKRAGDNSELQAIAHDVYEQFHFASLDASDLYVRNCRQLIELFVCETEEPYPYGDGIENRIVSL